MIRLKKCPCCGCAANIWEEPVTRRKYAMCYGCGLSTRNYETEEKAAAAWNRREREKNRKKEKNEPLTLEQLLEMDCQPVWVEHPDGYKHYNDWTLVFVSWKAQKQVRVTYANGGTSDVALLLNAGAKIYRRPPEQEGAAGC